MSSKRRLVFSDNAAPFSNQDDYVGGSVEDQHETLFNTDEQYVCSETRAFSPLPETSRNRLLKIIFLSQRCCFSGLCSKHTPAPYSEQACGVLAFRIVDDGTVTVQKE